MTMQRQDYERVAFGIQVSRDDLLETVERDTGFTDEERALVVKYVHRMSRDVAVQCAIDFYAVNKRFRVGQFLFQALGQSESQIALQQFTQEVNPQ